MLRRALLNIQIYKPYLASAFRLAYVDEREYLDTNREWCTGKKKQVIMCLCVCGVCLNNISMTEGYLDLRQMFCYVHCYASTSMYSENNHYYDSY